MTNYPSITTALQSLLQYGIDNDLIYPEDTLVVRNQLIDVLHLSSWDDPSPLPVESIDNLLGQISTYAAEHGVIEDTGGSKERFETRVMGLFTPMPHDVRQTFCAQYKVSPEQATNWYYTFSQKTNYVRMEAIQKNLCWKYDSPYGPLDITINLSKPEKDPKDIAAAKLAPQTKYPHCQLCLENEGFAGTTTHPARQNLRPVPITVGGSTWYFQYSPYGYYNEHCIVFREEHVPMVIDADVFGKLFDVLDIFPHYFIGSNADLPIVGGSILTHEHFQGGRYTFAMDNAPIETSYNLPAYPEVEGGILKWPLSVIRLRSANRTQLEAACARVLAAWRPYSDPEVEILAETDGTPHNTITPIARKDGNTYVCDLVLRNNRTTPERPLGLFHPRPALHHIKKENIGLIEVMGLAVLPARLAKELDDMAEVLVHGVTAQFPDLAPHWEWLEDIRARRNDITAESAPRIVKEEIGYVFQQVLEDAGVFRRDDQGHQAFLKFMQTL